MKKKIKAIVAKKNKRKTNLNETDINVNDFHFHLSSVAFNQMATYECYI